MNIEAAISAAARELELAGVSDPRREAASLLAFALGKDKTYLIAHSDEELTPAELNLYKEFSARRTRREPLQYIIRRQEFFGLEFSVSPDVLIPRPETESLVENAIQLLRQIEHPRFCEIGTGSGCIAIAALHQLPRATALAVDISESALAVARANAEKHHVADRIEFRLSDVFSDVPSERFDAVLSNPPYVPDDDLSSLQIEVGKYEPATSLAGGPDGLAIIKRITEGAPNFLVSGGVLSIEIGFNQSASVDEMLNRKIWHEVSFLPDLEGFPRILVAKLRP